MDGDKQNARHFRRNKKGNDQTPGKDGQAKQPEQETPISFHAHALDLEPGTIIPERPSLDLTYIDFTRESYDAGDKPFVPKKKKAIPFELSDTPHTQSEYWEGKSPGRRKSSPQGDAAAGQRHEDAPRPQQEKENDKHKQKQQKGKAMRNVLTRGKEDRKLLRGDEEDAESALDAGAQKETQRKSQSQSQGKGRGNARRQDQRRPKERGEAGQETRAAAGDAQNAESNEAAPEPSKESRMRPYWMKK